MSELTREELELWLHIARSLEQVGHERECETALAYLDRAERAEARHREYADGIAHAIGVQRQLRPSGEPARSDREEIIALRSERDAAKDELDHALQAWATQRRRAEEVLDQP